MLDIKNEKTQNIIDSINEHEEMKKKMLKEASGAIYLEILVPNVDMEAFEKWQLGSNEENIGYISLVQNCTGRTSVVFLNSLQGVLEKFKEENPMVVMANLVSQMKNNMVIDEEDMEDES